MRVYLRFAVESDSQKVYEVYSYRFRGGKNKVLRRKNLDDNEKDGGGLF
jgi:hypothetical protein